jgi:hypothetical protein
MANEAAPLVASIKAVVPGTTIAADDSFAIGECPYAGTVTAISYTPDAASTGDNTHYRTYTVVNKGQAGIGTTVIGTLALTIGVDLVAFDKKAFTLSVVAGATTVAAGDVLAFVSTHTSNGLVDPGGTVEISISRVAGS